MIEITYNNISELIFESKQLQKKLLTCQGHFDEWMIGLRSPALKHLMQKAKLDLLDRLNTEPGLRRTIEEHYLAKVKVVTSHQHRNVKNIECHLDSATVPEKINVLPNFCLTRDDKKIGLTLWR